MAWSGESTISSGVTVNSTTLQDASTSVTLNPGEEAHVQVQANWPVTPISNLIVQVQTSVDGGTDWDTEDESYMSLVMDSGGADPAYRSFSVSEVKEFRLMYKLDTGTDAVVVTTTYVKNGVSL